MPSSSSAPGRNRHESRHEPRSARQSTTERASPPRKHLVGVRAAVEELKLFGAWRLWLRDLHRNAPALTTSLIVHAVLLALLALFTLTPPIEDLIPNLLASTDDHEDPIEKLEENLEVQQEIQVDDKVSEIVETDVVKETAEIASFNDTPAAAISVDTSEFGLEHAPKRALMNKLGSTTGQGFEGRGEAARKARVLSEGGTAGSETAVGQALKWLVEHQMADGGWNFNHGVNNKHAGPVNDPGHERSTSGATAMALLPFLGAGQTHREGKYQETVQRGLYYLGRQMKVSPNGGDLSGLEGGNLYSHGLAAIALCEAYAISQDKALAAPAQQAINYIVYAQDKTGGGWRYRPGEPGDTSSFGWQLMALKSGHLAYLDVPPKTIAGAIHFLDSVQGGSGARFGYLGPGDGPATTAIGLLCRMYLGAPKDQRGLEAGVAFIGELGPSKNNMYFNYYATQVMHHWGGAPWKKWNEAMREQLIATQVERGTHSAEKGSWWTPGQQHGDAGGRLYETSLSTMTLEVYYRHMPLYRQAVGEQKDF
jgi:hypothetical protein